MAERKCFDCIHQAACSQWVDLINQDVSGCEAYEFLELSEAYERGFDNGCRLTEVEFAENSEVDW